MTLRSLALALVATTAFATTAFATTGVAAAPPAIAPDAATAAYDAVDPFIGTGGGGHTFPGATAPFGMVQLSPDTDIR